jgi:hypothetical protein
MIREERGFIELTTSPNYVLSTLGDQYLLFRNRILLGYEKPANEWNPKWVCVHR